MSIHPLQDAPRPDSCLCDTAEKIPHDTHYAIVRGTDVHVPADTPSIGYDERLCVPARNVPIVTYEAFADRIAWEAAVERIHKSGVPFKALIVQVAKVTTKIAIDGGV